MVRPLFGYLGHLAKTFFLKGGIPDGEYLVDEQNFRLEMRRDGKRKAHLHTAAVVLERRVEKALYFGEGDDLIELAVNLGLAHSQDRAAQVYILAAGEF